MGIWSGKWAWSFDQPFYSLGSCSANTSSLSLYRSREEPFAREFHVQRSNLRPSGVLDPNRVHGDCLQVRNDTLLSIIRFEMKFFFVFHSHLNACFYHCFSSLIDIRCQIVSSLAVERALGSFLCSLSRIKSFVDWFAFCLHLQREYLWRKRYVRSTI